MLQKINSHFRVSLVPFADLEAFTKQTECLTARSV